MSKDQLPFVAKVPEDLKTPEMDVTVFDGTRKEIMRYVAVRGLVLSEYVKGPGTTVSVDADPYGCVARVYSEKSGNLIQVHQGMYRNRR